MALKSLILRTAGTNNDLETAFALRRAGSETRRIHINRLKEQPALLSQFDIFILPGGFSYGDHLGAGTVLANEIRTYLEEPLSAFIGDGKIVIGICNGFQVLVKTGFLPGATYGNNDITLATNDSHRFEDRWVDLKGARSRTGAVEEGEMMYMPVAHAEGKLVCRNSGIRKRLSENGQIIFRYCGPDGGQGAGYPSNPNGSADDIAGLCDPTGRVIGMMPHPERFCHPQQHPAWTRGNSGADADGLTLFKRIITCASHK